MVVGGKEGPDRKLGTFATKVVKGGPSDLAGIVPGEARTVIRGPSPIAYGS
jgi:hypothetical protein